MSRPDWAFGWAMPSASWFADLPAPHPNIGKVVSPRRPPRGTHWCLLLALAGAITLTALYGMWWTFFVVGA